MIYGHPQKKALPKTIDIDLKILTLKIMVMVIFLVMVMNQEHLAIFCNALLNTGADRSLGNLVHSCIVPSWRPKLQTADLNHQNLWDK